MGGKPCETQCRSKRLSTCQHQATSISCVSLRQGLQKLAMACVHPHPSLQASWPWRYRSQPGFCRTAQARQAPIFGSFIGDSKFLPAASLALGDLSCLRPLVAVAATTSAWAAARRARARSQRSLCWATLATDKQGTTFLVGPEAATRLPSNVSLGRLLTWARKQAFMKVHPVLSASNAKLSVSVAVEAGTPLLGVLEEGFLTYEDSEDSWQQLYDAAKKQHPEWWALHLAIPLLRHASGDASDEASSPVWQAYQQSALDANSKRGCR